MAAVRGVAIFLTVLFALAARGDELRDEARAHTELAKIAYKQNRISDALVEFRKAYDLAPVPLLLFNIARCQEELHDGAAALRSYQQYLAALPDAADRAQVEARIEALRAEVAAQPAPEPESKPEPKAEPRAIAPMLQPAPAPVLVLRAAPPPARKKRAWIAGVVVGAAVVVGAITVGAVVGSARVEPFAGNISPGHAAINP